MPYEDSLRCYEVPSLRYDDVELWDVGYRISLEYNLVVFLYRSPPLQGLYQGGSLEDLEDRASVERACVSLSRST